VTVDSRNQAFFSPTALKFTLLSMTTLGLYQLYWFYRNWIVIKSRSGEDLMPFWRAFFAPLWAYSCFRHIRQAAALNSIAGPPNIGLLAIGYFILTALWRSPDPYWLVCFLSFIPLLPANAAIIRINERIVGEAAVSARISGWEWVILVVGGLLLVLSVIGAFMPPPAV
jgi:hypothetical protein